MWSDSSTRDNRQAPKNYGAFDELGDETLASLVHWVDSLETVQHSAANVERIFQEMCDQEWYSVMMSGDPQKRWVCREFVKAKGVQVIVTILQRHGQKANIQERALRMLVAVVESDETMLIQNANDTLVNVIFNAMTNHMHKASIQEHSCRILATLIKRLRWLYNPILVDIVNLDFMDTILSSIRDHASVERVQEQGCRVLAELAKCQDEDIATLVVAGGGIAVILEALQSHSNNTVIREFGFRALYNLAELDDNRMRISEAGGIDIVLSNLQNPAVKHDSGCILLAVLAEDNDIAAMIVASGCLAALLSVIQHSLHASDKEKAIMALGSLARNGEIAYKIVAAGGIPVILMAMQLDQGIRNTNKSLYRIYDCGWRLLRTLAETNDEMKLMIRRAIMEEYDGYSNNGKMTSQTAQDQVKWMMELVFGPS